MAVVLLCAREHLTAVVAGPRPTPPEIPPYDTTWYDYDGWPAGSPPAGSWQRNLNYFLEMPPGNILPATLVVGVSAILLMWTLFRSPKHRKSPVPLLLGFALANLVIAATMFLSNLFPGLPGIPINLLLLVALFVLQAWLIPLQLHARLAPISFE